MLVDSECRIASVKDVQMYTWKCERVCSHNRVEELTSRRQRYQRAICFGSTDRHWLLGLLTYPWGVEFPLSPLRFKVRASLSTVHWLSNVLERYETMRGCQLTIRRRSFVSETASLFQDTWYCAASSRIKRDDTSRLPWSRRLSIPARGHDQRWRRACAICAGLEPHRSVRSRRAHEPG